MKKHGIQNSDYAHVSFDSNTSAIVEMPKKTQVMSHAKKQSEKPISKVYPEIDNDLARDNLENDMTAADLQDLY